MRGVGAKYDYITRAQMDEAVKRFEAELERMRREFGVNHERLAKGMKEELDQTVASFQKGTRDFGQIQESRFSNAWRAIDRLAQALDGLEERTTIRGRLRRYRRSVRAFVRNAREHFNEWRESRRDEDYYNG